MRGGCVLRWVLCGCIVWGLGGLTPAAADPPSPEAIAADLPARLAAAAALQTHDLAEPVRSIRQGELFWAPNPDGKTWDLLQAYFPSYGGPNTLAIIDLASGDVRLEHTERGWNFHLAPRVIAPDGRLFISVLDGRLRQKICVYDPATNKLELGAVEMPDELLGETHPLVMGTDGKLYAFGQHPSRAPAAAQIDPATGKATFYGPIGPSHEPNACWAYSGAADDRYLYVASGKVPWRLVAYDRQTGTWEVLVETENVGGMVSVGQQPGGCTGSASGIKGTDGARVNYWLYEGKAIVRREANEPPPWPDRELPGPAPAALPPKPEVNLGLAVPDVDGWAEIWVRTAEAKAAAPADAPADADPETLGWQRFRYQTPLYPHAIYRLVELPDGRLFGTAGAYEGNFVFDPAAGESRHLGKCQLSHYATTFSGGKVYMSGYPTSPLYVYDPARPWTAGTFAGGRVIADDDPQANPRRLLYLGTKELAGTHKMYGAATAADGRVFFGGQWIRDGGCGGVAWYQPATGAAGGFWQPLSNYQVTHVTAARQGRTIVLSTRRIDDPVLGKPKPEAGALFFYDVAADRLSEPLTVVAGAKGTGPIVGVGDRVLGWAPTGDEAEQASVLYAVDVAAARVLFAHRIPAPLPVAIGSNQQEPWDFRLGPDGKVWTFLGNALLRIDPADGALDVVGRVERGGPLAFSGGAVYLGGTTALRRLELPGEADGVAR